MEALHNMATDNNNKGLIKTYTLARDKMFIVASESTIKKILLYENEAVGKENDKHDLYLTEIVLEIRKDLGIKDINFPIVGLKK